MIWLALLAGWVYTVERCGPWVRAGWARWMALRETVRADARAKWDAKQEHLAKTERQEKAGVVVLPNDLESVIMQESAQWLRDEQRGQMMALYAEFGDWQKVRASFGVGQMP